MLNLFHINAIISVKGGVLMKNFKEFKDSLTTDVMNEILSSSLKKADEKYEKVYGKEEDSLSKVIVIESYKNTFITLALLEKYHNWNN